MSLNKKNCLLGALKGADLENCSMQSADLTKGNIKILGICFSYTKKIMDRKNYR